MRNKKVEEHTVQRRYSPIAAKKLSTPFHCSFIALFTFQLLSSISCCALKQSSASNEMSTGRRALLAKVCAPAVVALSVQQSASAAFWQTQPNDRKTKTTEIPYDEFTQLLQEDRLGTVEFGFDGRSIVSVGKDGLSQYKVNEPPDDPSLLSLLYQKEVGVSVKAFKFQKQTNTVSWFRDLMGDDLTAEELYKYRGYKTQRESTPENNYIPSNLITAYDNSRYYMYDNKDKKPTSLVQDITNLMKKRKQN